MQRVWILTFAVALSSSMKRGRRQRKMIDFDSIRDLVHLNLESIKRWVMPSCSMSDMCNWIRRQDALFRNCACFAREWSWQWFISFTDSALTATLKPVREWKLLLQSSASNQKIRGDIIKSKKCVGAALELFADWNRSHENYQDGEITRR